MASNRSSIENLLTSYQNGSMEAFDQFYRRTNGALMHFLVGLLRDQSDAEDCLHDTYLKIHQRVRSYDPKRSAMTWIFAIARNTAIDRLRQRRRRELPSEDGTLPDSPILEKTQDQQDAWVEALSMLSAPDRNLLEKRFFNDQSYQSLAAELAVEPAALRQRVSRIIRAVRKLISTKNLSDGLR